MEDYKDKNTIYLDIQRLFQISEGAYEVFLPRSDLDMVMNYIIVPEAYVTAADATAKAAIASDIKTFVKGADGSAEGQWLHLDILADAAQYGMTLGASLLMAAAFTLY